MEKLGTYLLQEKACVLMTVVPEMTLVTPSCITSTYHQVHLHYSLIRKSLSYMHFAILFLILINSVLRLSLFLRGEIVFIIYLSTIKCCLFCDLTKQIVSIPFVTPEFMLLTTALWWASEALLL